MGGSYWEDTSHSYYHYRISHSLLFIPPACSSTSYFTEALIQEGFNFYPKCFLHHHLDTMGHSFILHRGCHSGFLAQEWMCHFTRTIPHQLILSGMYKVLQGHRGKTLLRLQIHHHWWIVLQACILTGQNLISLLTCAHAVFLVLFHACVGRNCNFLDIWLTVVHKRTVTYYILVRGQKRIFSYRILMLQKLWL